MKIQQKLSLIIGLIFSTSLISSAQTIEKVTLTMANDSVSGYYLAVRPKSDNIKAVLVLLSSFQSSEEIFPETRLHNVAYANDIITIAVSMDHAIYANPVAIKRINAIFKNVIKRYSADPETFALGGFDMSGNIALRYAEMAEENPTSFPVHPKAIFTIDSPVDLVGFWHYCEREIDKNFYSGSVGDAKYFIDAMTKEYGTIYNNLDKYVSLSPFFGESKKTGNEQFLKKIPVRLYYDTDINWQLKNRRRGFNDTHMPGGSELVNRLMLEGNEKAEFIAAKTPGVRRSGVRHPTSWSIVDESDCIAWIKQSIGILSLDTWEAPYKFIAPEGWRTERMTVPIDFAPQISYKGVEDIRFAPGWETKGSDGYWTYSFLWFLDGSPVVNMTTLDNDLTAYYSGLVGRNIESRKIPKEKIEPLKVSVKKIKTLGGDVETFSAIINMTDYMAQEPIMLNAIVHYKKCAPNNKTIVIFEISPQSPGKQIWADMAKMSYGVDCD